MKWRRSFTALLLCFLALPAFCLAGALPDPASMTDQEIFSELEMRLASQQTKSQAQQTTLESLQSLLGQSGKELQELQVQLIGLKTGSEQLKLYLQGLSLKLDPIVQRLNESASSLQSLSEEVKAESRKARLSSGIAIGTSAALAVVVVIALFFRPAAR